MARSPAHLRGHGHQPGAPTARAVVAPVTASQIRLRKSGTWGLAEQVPRTGGLDTEGSAAVQVVSCWLGVTA